VFVRFPLVDDPQTSLLVWTTTPWTLPSNQFAAVHPDIEYARVLDVVTGQRLIMASSLVEVIAGKVKRELQVEATMPGRVLLGQRYRPPYDYYYDGLGLGQRVGRLRAGGETGAAGEQAIAWRVVPAEFVTVDSGTGVVHQAPAFGEVDYEVLLSEQARFVDGAGPELICAVAADGTFTVEAPRYTGRWVKDCDKDICRELRERGLLFHQEQYLHEYPFCWRADEDPLIQYPRRSWFIRTTRFRDQMLDNNRHINWLPEHIRDGRFGNFLESNVDWALSRERYWGTPLPIWVCERTGQAEAIDSYASLLARPGVRGREVWEQAKADRPELPDDLKIHKPYIDEITYDSPFAPGSRMRRVPEVIDCWYDSGAMPFAQWGYPHTHRERFEQQFPADFISEALDQTRGWFYSQLAISTMMFGPSVLAEASRADDDSSGEPAAAPHPFPHPFRNCIVLGLMLAEWWESKDGKQRFLTEDEARQSCGEAFVRKVGKMSKQLRNYRSPSEIFDMYGADALRWYFFANQAPWNSILYSDRAIRESIPEFLLRLWNVYSFFVIYANIDQFAPEARLAGAAGQLTADELARASGYRPAAARSELDRWILSELHRTLGDVVSRMDEYDNYGACQQINEFVDGLSNWYVRRSRDRFWSSDAASADKVDAYWTLYECLLTTSKMVAPFVPFLAETMWQNLAGVFGARATPSVHLCDYPLPAEDGVDETLSRQMRLLREIASLGRAARMDAKLKVRQPLRKVEVILAESAQQPWLEAHDALLRDELNVKEIEYTKDATKYITYQVQPNFKRLGPRVGKWMPAVKKALGEANGSTLLSELTDTGKVTLQLDGQQIELDNEDIQVRLQAKPGWAAAQGRQCVVVLSTELTPELVREGLANDLVRLIQDRRKELGCQYTDRIDVGVVTASEELRQAVEENRNYIGESTLGVQLVTEALAGTEGVERQVGSQSLQLFVRVRSGG
ncbi:MAG: DUF5915 domain-containing protein, partial [Pirellulaceae bacterium]